MNNNNRGNNNNRRRGRGNNNSNRPNSGGGQQINRVDSRARGNAPQMLEKYRKLAHDGHLNGDRVTEEYYLQFADHYFRVMADTKVRQDELRQRPRDDRWQEGTEPDRAEPYRADSYRDEPDDLGDYGNVDNYGGDRGNGGGRREPVPRYEEAAEPSGSDRTEPAPAENAGPGVVYEPPQNPFVREGRSNRGMKPRRPRGEMNAVSDGGGVEAADPDQATEVEARQPSLDPSVLPPAISIREDDVTGADDEPEAKPRRRTRRARPAAGDNDETLQAVN
ncbi:MAG: DUF4167 domain-containing protein [Novosphingobium sp.]